MLPITIPSPRRASLLDSPMPGKYRFKGILEEGFHQKLFSALSSAGEGDVCPNQQAPAELELVRFEAHERLEDTLSRWTHRICGMSSSLLLEVNNFGGIPPYRIYARLLDATPLKRIIADLRKLDLYLTGNGFKPLETSNRHMIRITGTVNPAKFDNILYKLGRVEFREPVKICGLLLQRKTLDEWISLRQFYFSI